MNQRPLTVKQEAFCQAFIRLGGKTAAYREAYSTKNMKDNVIHVKANELFRIGKVSVRIEQIENELKERNKITIDEIVLTLADMLRFDIAEIYDEAGNLKHIHSIPKKARLMISELSSDEVKGTVKGKTVVTGQTKKVKVFDKLQAIEKLMKHFGGYKADNDQSKPEIHINWNEQKTYETPKEDEEIEK